MKLITTFPLERYDIPAFGQRARPGTSEARQSYYDKLQDLESSRRREQPSCNRVGRVGKEQDQGLRPFLIEQLTYSL